MNLEDVEKIRAKREARWKRSDGGPGSGNWGHVGRLGKKGGSQKGGGNAFRLTTKEKGKEVYTSQAKKRVSSLESISIAKSTAASLEKKLIANPTSTNFKRYDRAMNKLSKAIKRAKKYETRQKTADIKKYALNPDKYWAVETVNPNASRNILKDVKGRGKTAGGLTGGRVRGTKEAVGRTMKKVKK